MNQRRHAKAFPLAATLIIIALAICFVTFAVKALMVKYQVVQGGTKITLQESELVALDLSNQWLQNRKEMLTSPPELKSKLENGWFKGLLTINEKVVIPVGREVKIAPAPPPDVAPTLPSNRPPKTSVAAANVLIGREDGR